MTGAELAAAMGSPAAAVGVVLGRDCPQVPLAEDHHRVGDLGPDGERELFRVSVRARAVRRDLHGLDLGMGQDLYRVRTRCRADALRFGVVGGLRQDRGSCLPVCCT
jgi:hypothetical protein